MFLGTTVEEEEVGGEADTGEAIEVILAIAPTAVRLVAGELCCSIPSSDF